MSRLFLFLRKTDNRSVTFKRKKGRSDRRNSDRRSVDRRVDPRFSISAPPKERRQIERRAT
jgi:hypothetical protein